MVGELLHQSSCTTGTYGAPEIGLFAGWVAHEGSFADGQVFTNEKKDVALLFSGECLVEAERRRQLMRAGHHLDEAPGGWLVHEYEEKGDRFLPELNGFFSGVLIDRRIGRALLFNDRYGVERLYWSESNGDLYFASEAKALLQTVPRARQFDIEGVAQFLAVGCTLPSRTLFRGIHILPAGSKWTLERGRWRSGEYFSPATWEEQQPLSAKEFEVLLDETFATIVPLYFEPESKVGIALTGGLDTRMVLACRAEAATRSISYTYAGTEGNTRDVNIAAKVAELCGIEHHVIRIGAEFMTDFPAHVDKTVYVTDGCFGVTGAHELYLSAKARRLAPVRLTGVFGGEILRGISTIKPVGLSSEVLDPALRASVAHAATLASNRDDHPVGNAAFRNGSAGLFGSLAACRSQVTFRTPFLNNRIVSLACRAPAGVRASQELGARLVRRHDSRLASVPTDRRSLDSRFGLKQLLRRLEGDLTFKLEYIGNEGLPSWLSPFDSVLDASQSLTTRGRHKYLKYRGWFRRELAGYITERLDVARRSSFWNQREASLLAEEHISGRRNNVAEINAVLTLEAVERLLIRTPLRKTIDQLPSNDQATKS